MYRIYNPIEITSYRRKFRSETSDNMDSWKAEVGRVRREKIRREKIRRERVRRKKMQMREKVGKSRNTVFFQWFVAPEGRKVGSLKRRVRSQLARWEMKICTPLWREAHFEVKMLKTPGVRTTFGSSDVEKVHAVVARSTFQSENVQNTPFSEHFWKLRCRKSARRCGAKHILKATTACTFSTSDPPKVARTCSVLYILTSKCASRHNGVHFFDISTSKSGPRLVCFVHFDLEMCFAPQRRALFRHRNFQKWSEAGVFCTFWLQNVLQAITACTFSTSQLPKVVREWCVLYILTWKCASRHNGVHFFDIATSKSGPNLVCFVHFYLEMCFAPQRRAIFHLSSGQLAPHPRFSEPTFRPSGATNHWQNTVNRDFPTFSRICIFFLLTLSLLLFSLLIFLFSLPLPCSAFHLSILSEVWLLNFLR